MQSETVTIKLIVAADGALQTLDRFDKGMTDSANASLKAGAATDAFHAQLARQRTAMEAGLPVLKARAQAYSAEERAIASALGRHDSLTKARLDAERELARVVAASSNLVVRGRMSEAEALRTVSALELAHAEAIDRATAAQMRNNGVTHGSGGFNTANIAAQFQDIGVTAAMGMNPLQIALQQGTQISAALGPMGAAGAAKQLGAALLAVVSPMSLLTIGAVAGVAAVVQWGMSATGAAEDATKAMERHNEALSDIVKGYAAAEAAVSDYLAGVERLPRAIAAFQLNDQFEDMQSNIKAITEQAAKFGNAFEDVGSAAEQGFGSLSRQFAEGKITAEEYWLGLQGVRGELNGLESALGGISVARFIAEMEQGAIKAMAFGDAISNLVAQTHALAGLSVDSGLADYFERNSPEKAIEALKGLTPELRTQKEIIEETYRAAMANPAVGLGGGDALTEAYNKALAAQGALELRQKAARDATAGGKSTDQWSSAANSLQERIAQQEMEASLLGQSTFEIEKQRAAFDLLNQAKAAGLTITPDLNNQVDQMATAYATATVELERMAEAQRLQEEMMNFYKGTFSSFVSDFTQGLRNGESVWESFGNAAVTALNSIADRLMSMATDGLFDMLFGSLMGGLTGGMGGGMPGMSSITGSSGGFFPGFADGTNFAPGGMAWVGERGPELLNLPRGSQVIPSGPSRAMAKNGGKGGPVQLIVQVSGARGNAEIMEMARSGAAEALDSYRHTQLQRDIHKTMDDPMAFGNL